MTEKTKRLFKESKSNKAFCAEILADDGSKPPGMFADSTDKHIWTAIYYGWLLGQRSLT